MRHNNRHSALNAITRVDDALRLPEFILFALSLFTLQRSQA
jgi:hypothetical protein